MNEFDWLTCVDPIRMLSAVICGKVPITATHRRLRLFACGCARQMWQKFDRRAKLAIEMAELFAEDERHSESVYIADRDLRDRAGEEGFWVTEIEITPSHPYEIALWCLQRPFIGNRIPSLLNQHLSPARQCDIIRAIHGNPFQYPCNFLLDLGWQTWRDGVIPRVAETIYQEYAFDQMGILADAIEEYGCQDDEILSHVRGEETCRCLFGRSSDLISSLFKASQMVSAVATSRADQSLAKVISQLTITPAFVNLFEKGYSHLKESFLKDIPPCERCQGTGKVKVIYCRGDWLVDVLRASTREVDCATS